MARPKKNTNTQALADKMRKAVLQAAIEGKLTEQHQDDGDARELLAQIETEKQRLVKAGKIKRQKSLPDITEEEKPFDIPDNWEWVKFGSIVHFNMGKTPPRNNLSYWGEGLPWVSIADMTNSSLITNTKEKVSLKAIDNVFKNRIVKSGTMLMSFKLSIGRVSILKIDAVHNEAIISINPFNDIDLQGYLFHILEYVSNWGDSKSAIKGKTLNSTSLNNMLIPLPPIAEQQRIVAKLKAALAQIDNLHADENALYALQTAFPRQMQASLLQAAIEGKLTQQDATKDGHASDLLAEIESEKQRLIQAGEIKRQKTLPPIIEDEKPFDIPDNWEWVRLGDLTYNRGQKKPDKKFSYIDIASIDNKTQILNSDLDIISPSEAPSRARKIVEKGDIIYATVRPYLMNITIIDRNIEPEPIVSTGFAVLATPYEITNKYLFHVLMSPHFNAYANHSDNSKGVAYPAINDSRLMNGIIPLPPLAEQQRIVELLDQALPEIRTLKDI